MYTHRITYTRQLPHLGPVACSFRTVADAVAVHVIALSKQREVFMVKVEEL